MNEKGSCNYYYVNSIQSIDSQSIVLYVFYIHCEATLVENCHSKFRNLKKLINNPQLMLYREFDYEFK